jgi:ApbE superfamily uncharacterized protein (UPF0280 family)
MICKENAGLAPAFSFGAADARIGVPVRHVSLITAAAHAICAMQ